MPLTPKAFDVLRLLVQNTGHMLGKEELLRAVEAVATVRVRQLADSLIIAAELIDVVHDAQLWGQHYQRKISDVFKVQEEIAFEICHNLRLQLSKKQGKQLSKRYTETPAAHQLYQLRELLLPRTGGKRSHFAGLRTR